MPTDLTDEKCRELLQKALESTVNSEDLWLKSGEGSGAAVLTRSGKIYSASQKSRASGGGRHAEALALDIAAQNNQKDPVVAVALVSSNPKARDQFWRACGHCRQEYSDHLLYLRKNKVIEEDYDITFIFGKPNLDYKTYKLSELLPYAWEPADKG